MEKNSSKYVIGGCFALCAIIYVIWVGSLGIIHDIYRLFHIASFFLMSIAFFTSVPFLFPIGAGAGIMHCLMCLISWGVDFEFIFRLAFFTILLVCSVTKNNNKVLYILAGIFAGISHILPLIIDWKWFYGSSYMLLYILLALLCVIACVLLYKNPSYMPIVGVTVRTPVNREKTPATLENDINRLTRMKELLDKGIISQEEFDHLKKEIIG